MLPYASAMLLSGAASGGGANITLGYTGGASGSDLATPSSFQFGTIAQASANSTLNFITCTGPSAGSYTGHWRAHIYQATNSTTVSGSLLGSIPDQTNMSNAEVRKVALSAPVSVTSGQWYAIVIESDSGMAQGSNNIGGVADRFWSQSYASGPANPAPASGSNSAATRCLYASTT